MDNQPIIRHRTLITVLGVLLALALALAAPALLTALSPGGGETPAAGASSAQAYTGTIRRVVYGAGSVQPASQPGVYAGANGRVARTFVAMGDRVRQGDVLMELENDALSAEIAQLEYDLAQAQLTVENEKTYETMRYEQLYWPDGSMRYDVDTGEPLRAEYSNQLSVRAPCAGRVAAVYIEPGDDALAVYREHGAVIVLSTDGRMRVVLEDAQPGLLALGDTVAVRGDGVEAAGVVENIERRGLRATVVIQGDTYPYGAAVQVFAPSGSLAGTGTLDANKPIAVSAYGGVIRTVGVRVGQLVEDDEPLARFTRESIPLHIDNALVLKDYAVAKTALEEAVRLRDALTITAPCDGAVVSVDAAVGTDVAAGGLCLTLVEDAGMEIVLTVDELDIPFVRPGQPVEMTVDALPGVTVAGVVEKIAPLGNTETAVTTYDVTVCAQAVDSRVLGGMNVSGEILIEEHEDAVLIPTDALRQDAQGDFVALQGGEVRRVQIGIVTADSAQILSGLAPGEEVFY